MMRVFSGVSILRPPLLRDVVAQLFLVLFGQRHLFPTFFNLRRRGPLRLL
ncbi:MAG: hypothetical protein NTW86_02415 [Candidatus Sumerlaeota bacterium]|nr:hypothetical protein [Candidatus Sumerlaeota bacterium]